MLLLIAPLFTIVSGIAPQQAYAVATQASDGSCIQDVGSTAGVLVTRLGNDCLVEFTSTTSTTWKSPSGISNVRYLVVGGGASGDRGVCAVSWGHGGGGGQVRDSTLSVTPGTSYTVAPGKGGAAATTICVSNTATADTGNSGTQSVFASITAAPGIRAVTKTAVGGTSGAGFVGGTGLGVYPAGGGGGAGGTGISINGGIGVYSNITGTEFMYGSGGAGRNDAGFGSAYSGGGGDGVLTIANRGGGGADTGSGWGAGADGVVILRYTDRFIVTFDNNGASSGTPSSSSITQSAKDASIALSNRGTLVNGTSTFMGWNTQSDGRGTNFPANSSYTPTQNTTLYAQWNSTITYNTNTATSTRAIESTTATSSQSNTTLSDGKLIPGSPVSSQLLFNLNAADSSSIVNTTWYDANRNGVTGAIVGSPTYNSQEGYFLLNGTSQYINLGSTVMPTSGTNTFTASVMFKSDNPSDNDEAIMSRFYGNGSFIIRNLTHSTISTWRANVEVSSPNKYSEGDINYATITYNGSILRLYLNGVLQNSGTIGGANATTADLVLGARGYLNSMATFWAGRIYSAQGYSRALTDAEVLANYQAMLPGQKVTKTNYSLAPWNASSSGMGIASGTTVTDLSALPAPYLRLQPSNYNAVAKTWSSTPGSSSFTYRGTPELITSNNGKFGATGNFPAIGGTTTAGINLNNPKLTTYTLCVVARYRGLAATPAIPASQGRLINGTSENWISGFHYANISEFHHTNDFNFNSSITDLSWHYYCDSGNRAWWDGTKVTPWTFQSTTYLPPISINNPNIAGDSDWELADLIIYDQFLADSQIEQVNRYFKNTYGITSGSSSQPSAVSVSPLTTYSSTGDTTLYANWGSSITYDGNKQTSGLAPSPTFITGVSGSLATNSGALARLGSRFDGWNTAANGTGTFYSPGATYLNTGNIILYAQYSNPLTFPTEYSYVDPLRLSPYMRFKAQDYDETRKVWVDSSGNGRSTSLVRGAPSVVSSTVANGSTKSFKVLTGATTAGIKFNNPTFTGGNYTLITVARYSGATKLRIFDGEGDNYLHSFYNGYSGVAHHNGWVTSEADVHGSNWVLGTSFASNYRSNGTSRGTSGGTNTLSPLTINFGTYYTTQSSHFEVAEVLIFDYKLTTAQIAQVEDYLSKTYGITIATPGTYPTSTSLAIAAGVGGRSETLTAINGLGNKTFTLSPTRSGFSLDTSTVNSVALVISPVVASGVYAETITATESGGETATYNLTVTVSPSVKFDTSTATTVITTLRRGATLRLNTVGGVGTKIFTMTSVNNSFTLDTSTASIGYATLRVDTYTAVGTYSQTITVTDDTKIRSTYIVTITINAPPTLSSTSAITTAPVLADLKLNLDAGDTASYGGTGTSWTDLSGAGNNATWQVAPTFTNSNGGTFTLNGSTQYATTSSIRSDVFTVEVWAKFNVLNNNYACLVSDVYTNDKINYAICFWNNGTIRAGYHQSGTQWVGGQTGAFTPVVGTWYQFVYTVAKSGSDYIGSLYVNNSLITGQTKNTIAPTSNLNGIRIGRNWYEGQYINGSIPVVRIYNRALSTAEIAQNYNALLPRFTNNPTNSITITTTESVTASSSIYYAGLGTGVKTFALSNSTTGISIDTTIANTVKLNVANTVNATSATVSKEILQVISATDTSGIAAATPVYVKTIINPKVAIAASTPLTLTTTAGKIAYDTFTATYGTGNKTFTGVSSAYPSAFVVTNPSTNVGLLTVGNNLPAGTYYETITATDSVGGVTNYLLTVIVNSVPTIAGATGNTLSTTLSKAATLRINVLGGTGTRTIAWTSPNAGITLDASTVASQNYATLSVSNATPTGTYSFTISATDTTTARASDTFTVIVNRWPVLGAGAVVATGLAVNLDASTYSGTGTWNDSSGFARNATLGGSSAPVGSAPTFSSDWEGNFSINAGTNQIQFPNPGSLETFTVSTWVKVPQATQTGNPAILGEYATSGNVNFMLQLYLGKIVGQYRVGSTWSPTMGGLTPVINKWMYITFTVSKIGTGSYMQTLYLDGVSVSTQASTLVPAFNGSSGGVILLGRRWDLLNSMTGDIGAVSIYNRALTAAEIVQNYNATGSRFISTNSGTDLVTVTQGVRGSISGVSATQGTGDKTFALSNTSTGISLTTPSANTFTLTLPDTLTALTAATSRVITETVTATDQTNAATSRIYTITVNPPVKIESTTATITTTSGIVAWDTFTATLGTGSKTFALTGTPSITGFTLTQANNQAVLKVEPTVNPGTYTLTIRATDSLGAVTSINKTVVVNARPTISGNPSVVGTRDYAFVSPNYTAANGTGTLTFSMTKASAIPGGDTSGITLSSTTGSPTINVASNVASDTYTVTLRVTDSLTAFSTFVVTIRVNLPVSLDGNKSLTKVYGEELSQVYTTSSGTSAPFNIFASGICTTEKSTYVGNGTNGDLNVTYTVEKLSGIGNCNWQVPTGVTAASVMTVAGGGGGGGFAWAGGGGAGGVVYVPTLILAQNAIIPIVVGGGGAGGLSSDVCSSGVSPSQGTNGEDSSFNATFTSKGGGGGGGYGWSNRAGCGSGKPGGSGGGSGETDYNPVRATSTQGTFAGATSYGNSGGLTIFIGGIQAGAGGGGAGVGAVGASTSSSQDHVAGDGGAGISSLITGTSLTYGGGGGGATCSSCTGTPKVGTGGSGGGGNGGNNATVPVNGTNGLGGGGGGSQTGSGGKGGSGIVIVRYVTPVLDTQTARITMDTLSITPTGSIRLNAPKNLPVATYTQTIKVTDSTGSTGSTPVTVTLTVTKATPTVLLSLPGSVTTAKYGSPVVISAVATTAGEIAFVNGSTSITACTAVLTTAGLATCTWTPTSVGATTLKATLKPTDTLNYNNSAEVSLSITVAKADTLTVTVGSQTLRYTGSAVAATRAFTTTGLVAIDSLTAISMLFSGTANTGVSRSSTTAPTDAGTYTITPNYPADASAYTFAVGSLGTTSSLANYESVTVIAGTLTVNRALQVMTYTYANSNTATYSPGGAIASTATSRLGSGAKSYTSSTPEKCTIDAVTSGVSIVEAGTCRVNMIVAQTANYVGDTATATITINKAVRTFVLTPAVSTLKYSDTTTVTATLSGGASDGEITYTLGSPTGCSFDPLSGVLTATSGTVQCPLTATISTGVNYLAETATAISLTIARANAPVITLDTVTAMDHTPETRAVVTPNFNVSGLKGTDLADSITYTYSFVSNPFQSFIYSDTRTPIDAGTYRITPSALALSSGLITNYETPLYSSSAIDFVINRISQETLTIENTNGEVDVPFTLKPLGGTTGSTVSFAWVSGTYCTVSGNQLIATQPGTCFVTVTMPGNRNFTPVTSESVTVRVRNFVTIVIAPPLNTNTGISIGSVTTLEKGSSACTTGCTPKIISINAEEVAENDLIIITGESFNGVTKVLFNRNVEAPNFVIDSDTQIQVRVPANLPFGLATLELRSPGGLSGRYSGFEIIP